MDGYALRVADVPQAGADLPVSQRIPLASWAAAAAAGTAARIFTGAPRCRQAPTRWSCRSSATPAGDGAVQVQGNAADRRANGSAAGRT
jgi:molybdopterin biosynthesis enzyme